MRLGWRTALWALLHPNQVIKAPEVEWLFQEFRLILAATNADIRNAQLTREERQRRISKNKEMLQLLDRLLNK